MDGVFLGRWTGRRSRAGRADQVDSVVIRRLGLYRIIRRSGWSRRPVATQAEPGEPACGNDGPARTTSRERAVVRDAELLLPLTEEWDRELASADPLGFPGYAEALATAPGE